MTRDDKGRFIKGHENVGAGRKPKSVEESYLELFKSAVTTADWIAIIRKAIEQAKKGDPTARKFVADYLIGAPVQRVAPTTAEGKTLTWKDFIGGDPSE